jgi:drug/metabolite transporter (DMT)-like permease
MCYVMMIIFVCVKQLPIVNVAICMNMGPLFTVFLAALLQGETITWVLIAHIVMAFSGVLLITFGTNYESSNVNAISSNLFYYLLMISAPIAIGFGNLQVSKISQNPNILSFFIPWWVSLANTLIFGVICVFL